MPYYIRFLIILIIPFCISLSDELRLNDGSVIVGKIIKETDKEILIETAYGQQTIPVSDIKDIIRDKSQEIHLKDGSIIKGKILSQDQNTVIIKTKYGTSEISHSDIKEILFVKEPDAEIQTPTFETEMAGMGKAFLYESQKKDIGVGLGLQMLGGGLLYAEKYGVGATMLALENGLLISSMFVEDPDARTGLLLGGILLKGINTFFTIKSINNYNRDVRYRLGLEGRVTKNNMKIAKTYAIRMGILSSNFGYRKSSEIPAYNYYTGEYEKTNKSKKLYRIMGFNAGLDINYGNNTVLGIGYMQRGSTSVTDDDEKNTDHAGFLNIGITQKIYLESLIESVQTNTIYLFAGLDFGLVLYNSDYQNWHFGNSTIGIELGLGYILNKQISLLGEYNLGYKFNFNSEYYYSDFGVDLIYTFKQ